MGSIDYWVLVNKRVVDERSLLVVSVERSPSSVRELRRY
ncbi:hypothetical protein GXM_09808 [Nostoc sphaeroides CCNUC1]|uniref:Uncharacterized protein n=1 Tax=Nostoc sphaeroides CCNUC1 TaxID=2653204 RepID=A0A5P8WHX5_9NOSO|nr:hypothetical protein GXM_09808 [Nostoc sphaeroides CCNUC1]